MCTASTAAPNPSAPVAPTAPPPLVAPSEARASEWTGFRIIGGLTLNVGLGSYRAYSSYGGDPGLQEAFALELKAGVLFARSELTLAISPMATLIGFKSEPNLTATILGGHFFRLTSSLSYTPRVGVGMMAVNTQRPFFRMRFDPATLTYRVGRWLLEVAVPSIRLNLDVGRHCAANPYDVSGEVFCNAPLLPVAEFFFSISGSLVTDDLRE